MPGYATIAPPQLARLIGTPDAPALIDVRTDEDFDADPRLIATARRIPHAAVADMDLGGIARAVVICHRGAKLSEGAAAILRLRGVQAETLAGGFVGWAALGLPLTPWVALPKTRFWVTRQRPKIDRIACPWLIRRFVDPDARFLFVAPSEVAAVAERFDATPFDTEGAALSHRGPMCSFDAMLDDFALHTDALDRLAQVVRAADTDAHDLSPQAAGLLAISVGLSKHTATTSRR